MDAGSLGGHWHGRTGKHVINGKAYLGIGKSRDAGTDINQFYEYDPAANTRTRKADFPGPTREDALGIAIGNFGYAGFGANVPNSYNDFWKYDPSKDSWTQLTNFPAITLEFTVGFSLNDSIAFIGGTQHYPQDSTTWWQYNSSQDVWTQKNNFPGLPCYLQAE